MDAALKQRLVGASVIIALAVIFIPMLFNNGNQNQSISIDIPDEPSDLQERVISIDKKNNTPNNNQEIVIEPLVEYDSPIEIQETIIDIVDNSKQEISKPVEEILIEKVKEPEIVIINKPKEIIVKETKPKPSIQTKPKPVETIPSKPVLVENNDSSYRVKFGVFSQQKNAQQVKAKIIHNGMDAIVEKDAATGMYKVYSKQYIRKSSVEKIQQQAQNLNLNIGKTSIEKLDKKASDDAEQLLDTGWIVQIGIFSSQENSVKLRDKIRNKGFICFVDEIVNDKKQKLYRVRVGPYAEHSETEAIKNNIKTKMNLKGLIKPHEKQKVVN